MALTVLASYTDGLMEKETKKILGVVLGELYRIQNKLNIQTVSDATIYGLTRGMESVIDAHLNSFGFVPSDLAKKAAAILQPYFDDPAKPFEGYYQIERELEEAGIDRGTAHVIFTYFKADGAYEDVIAKMDTSHSPSECRTFNLPAN